MKSPSPRVIRTAIGAALAISALGAAPAMAQEKVSLADNASVMKFMDPFCMDDDGKVSGKTLNGATIVTEKKGCLTVKTADGKTFYIMKTAAKGQCVKRTATGPVATVTAGSAGANEC